MHLSNHMIFANYTELLNRVDITCNLTLELIDARPFVLQKMNGSVFCSR